MARFPTTTKIYQVVPGTIEMDDGSTQILTFDDLVELYNVDAADCILGPITGINEARYIKLAPRSDGGYDDINFQVELGNSISLGPNFDGNKHWVQETNPEELYREQNSEQKL